MIFNYDDCMTYQDYLPHLSSKIDALPPCEFKYYLVLMTQTLKNCETNDAKAFVKQLFVFTEKLDALLRSKTPVSNIAPEFKDMTEAFKNLVDLSNTQKLPVKIGYLLLKIAGAIAGFITGFLCGIIGGLSGLVRGIVTLNNPLKFTAYGFATGACLGAIFAYRAPQTLLTSAYFNQLKFCLEKLSECTSEAKLPKIEDYVARVKEKYFNNNDVLYEEFKKKTSVQFSICTITAVFVHKSLSGFLGHHAFIQTSALDLSKPTLLEFALSETKTKIPHSQPDDIRTVSAEKMLEMLALHELLRDRNPPNMKFIATKLTPGLIDCFTHVNEILLGTNQEAARVGRFADDSQNCIGKNLVCAFFKKESVFPQEVPALAINYG